MKLFTDSIEYAKHLIEISEQDLAIIMQTGKTLLLENTEQCVKNQELIS